ncbi:tRNA (guanosine(37)-N1)-methyltransferase TrmD [Halobacillus yeomjeoni]|uniref:tRNA (guanine-N(1)-)-methyltransferase n=1 Tax=Halobacillus yeomjeoni TaxID=311194 RepID=A0A931HTP2_9BACI|nr:tRNA (guanosine(37)-N1)-methyltransferase TrmD [Halobacillus yeomjeoni]MBH0229251.1 tRNA (guanosine(37)-N1)-methyltransferase TrmD [Halobacillus yeomjeoni]MCA0983350.1 tRNA (guanosine(37)-N1)-methyltransferase TrmD [Halobacillus yeomjeoni]
MHIDILTLFPDMFDGVLNTSIMKRAQERDAFSYQYVNFRDYTTSKHNKVDDYPYGGGAGLVLTPQPIFDAIDELKQKSEKPPRVVLMCPQGEPHSQQKAEELAQEDHLIFICGHYEGYDERIRQELVTDEISLGDYVLTGGELGAMVVMDSVIRLIPGVLGNKESAPQDSFSNGLLEHPHYTRPAEFRGHKVPDVLLSGNHAKIDEWRHYQSLKRTFERRPDLLEDRELTPQEKAWIEEWKNS